MKKIIMLLLLLAGILPLQVEAVSARSAIVIDGQTGEVLFSQNADERLPMASTTKIMTAITAIENFDLDKTYQVKREYTLVEGSSMYLKVGEQITLRETLYGLMLMSGNDAALAVAGECGGLDNFVKLMNQTAEKLGLTDTHFDNPNGLDGETHYTTARELAKLAAYAMQNEDFRTIVSTKTYQSNGRSMANHNKLLRLYTDAVGIKTGFTKKSGRCLVSAAERDGIRLVAVTLNAPDDWNDHISMLENAFSQYDTYILQTAGEVIRTQPVAGGGAVAVAARDTVAVRLTAKAYAEVTTQILGAHFTYAPIRSGSDYGMVRYCINGVEIARGALCFAQGAALLPEEKSQLEQKLQDIVEWFHLEKE